MALNSTDIGILSGTFDPVHMGHLGIAEAAKQQLKLLEVRLIPTSYTIGKAVQWMTPIGHRRTMLQLAVSECPWLKVSSLHVTQENTEESWQVLRSYSDIDRGKRQIFFLIGCDALNRMSLWDQPGRASEICRIVAIPRPGCNVDPDRLQHQLRGIAKDIVVLKMNAIDISSSDIRCRVGQGLPIVGLVPDKVAAYISEHHLYESMTGT